MGTVAHGSSNGHGPKPSALDGALEQIRASVDDSRYPATVRERRLKEITGDIARLLCRASGVQSFHDADFDAAPSDVRAIFHAAAARAVVEHDLLAASRATSRTIEQTVNLVSGETGEDLSPAEQVLVERAARIAVSEFRSQLEREARR